MSDPQGYDPYARDPHGAVGAYVADALDDDERAVFEQHLEGCENCRREVAEFTETAAELTWLSEATPPPSLRTSLLWQIATVRPLPPEQPAEGLARHLSRSSDAGSLLGIGKSILWTGGTKLAASVAAVREDHRK